MRRPVFDALSAGVRAPLTRSYPFSIRVQSTHKPPIYSLRRWQIGPGQELDDVFNSTRVRFINALHLFVALLSPSAILSTDSWTRRFLACWRQGGWRMESSTNVSRYHQQVTTGVTHDRQALTTVLCSANKTALRPGRITTNVSGV